MSEVTFPVEIGLVGAPNSGKSKVVNEYIRISAEWFEEAGRSLVVNESPGERIEALYDVAMGMAGGYRENLWAVFETISEERLMKLAEVDFISVGTVLDSLAHAGVRLESLINMYQNGLGGEDIQGEIQLNQATVGLMTQLFLDNFRYKFAFYIPTPEKKLILPDHVETDEDRFNARVDVAIQSICQNFNLRLQILDKTPEENAQIMHDTVVRIFENGADVIESPNDSVESPDGLQTEGASEDNEPSVEGTEEA